MMHFSDSVTYLPDDILTKVDRASMQIGLEARVPLLDHRVVEFAWRQPLHRKIRNGSGKWLLRQVLHRYVPAGRVERTKMGVGAPIGQLRPRPVRRRAHGALRPPRLSRAGFLRAGPH